MKNKLLLITALLISALFFPIKAQADVPEFSVKLYQPKSPTNQNNLKLTFVTLDTQDRTVTVKCYKKTPSDAGFTQFDTDKVYVGGNSGYCDVTSTIMNNTGSYSFYVTASNGIETLPSQTITVDYNTSGPGTPGSYSKEKINTCDYRIKFRTSDDGGKTAEVELFRSDTKNISIDGGGRVATISIGSNQDGQIVNSVPDCQKEYFYALRAVDSSDNVSGLVGDGYTKIITETSTTTTEVSTNTQGALLAGSTTQVNQLANEEQIVGDASADKTSGEATPESITITPSPEVLGTETSSGKEIYKWLLIPLLLIAGFFIYRSYKKIV